MFNPLNTELNPTCHLLALLGAYQIFHVSRVRVNCYVVYGKTVGADIILFETSGICVASVVSQDSQKKHVAL
jgi:hypothetical protein